MHSSRAPAGVSCLVAQVINEMLNQWFNKTLFSIFSSQSLVFAFSSDVASPQSSTWGGVLRWHSHKPIVASWAVDYGEPWRKEVGAPWDKQNGPPGSSGTDSVGPVTPRGVRCCITSIPSIRGEWGGFTLAGEPRLVTPLHTHCGIEQRPNISPHYTTTTAATRGDAQNILWFIFGKFSAYLLSMHSRKKKLKKI